MSFVNVSNLAVGGAIYFFALIEFPSQFSTLSRSFSDMDSQMTGATARE